MNILICTIKSWNIKQAMIFSRKYINKYRIKIITSKEEFVIEEIKNFLPRYIFFPHWSYLIPDEIYDNFECVVFHMTDLPFGRGGSPLQNLIARGIYETKISAIRVTGELDAGPIYLKVPLGLQGSAQDIFIKISKLVFQKMIPQILEKEIMPKEQEGESFVFTRRKKEDGRITENMSLRQVYDWIRMLDAEGYPKAFLELGNIRFEFSKVKKDDGKLVAFVEIMEEADE